MINSNEDMHPTKEGQYWNNQGVEYLRGVNKPYSPEDAKRCFFKACSKDDKAAISNLDLLVKNEIIILDDNETKELEWYKSSIGTSNTDRYSELTSDDLNAHLLRKKLEKLLSTILGEKYHNMFGSKDLESIDLIYKDGYISENQKNELHRIRIWENSRLHITDKIIPYEFDEKWFESLDELIEKYS